MIKKFTKTLLAGLVSLYVITTISTIIFASINLTFGIVVVVFGFMPILLMSLIRTFLISQLQSRVVRNGLTFCLGLLFVVGNLLWQIPFVFLIFMVYYTDKIEQMELK